MKQYITSPRSQDLSPPAALLRRRIFYIQAAEMPVPPAWIEMLADMRKHAKGGGIGFSVIQTKSRGSVPIWIDDINACATDEELVDLILKCISE